MRRLRGLAILAAAVLTLAAAPAYGWLADFFFTDASGNGTYEAMAIEPEAVYDAVGGKTYMVFQGPGLDPYITAVSDTGVWDAPVHIGQNSLATDTHGGPSLVIDSAGYIHVFYGGHNSTLSHAVSLAPRRISGWVVKDIHLGTEAGSPYASPLDATYPQPWLAADGRIGLVFRMGDTYGAARKMDWNLAFLSAPVGSAEPTWTPAETILDDTDAAQFYASTYARPGSDRLHVGFIRRDIAEDATDQFVRRDVYYMQRDTAGEWVTAGGASIGTTRTVDYLGDALATDTYGDFSDQVVVREAPDGAPALLYLQGTEDPASYRWTYRRWMPSSGGEWSEAVTIATTDHSFDAGDLIFDGAGTAHAYVTAGGVADDQANPRIADEMRFAARGGDIEHWTRADGPGTWTREPDLATSSSPSARYNNPQVLAGPSGAPAVFFSEWNNDATSFIHKLFLFSGGRFVQREVTPDVRRLAGDNRIETATRISREAFPSGADTVVLASSADYADALCGVPLAQSYRAPVLLCSPVKVAAVLESEIRRLKPSRIVLLGGEAALSDDVKARVRAIRPGATVSRISGANRYETSSAIADALARRKGTPSAAMLASGAGFADALTASPFAARRGIPVLLTAPKTLPTATKAALQRFGIRSVVIVGGAVAVDPAVEAQCVALPARPVVERWAGANRYETAEAIAGHALGEGHTLERPVIASGATFADAVPGGLLAARYNTAVVLVRPTGALPAASERVLTGATRVIEAYVLGGEVAVAAEVENAVAAVLDRVEAK